MPKSSAMKQLVYNIKVLLESRGWTQARLAQESRIPKPNISRILAGEEKLSIDRAERIAKAFDMKLVDLLNENLEQILAVPA